MMSSRNGSSSSSNNFQRGDANRSTFPRRRGVSAGQPYPAMNRPSEVPSAQATDFQRGDPIRSSCAGRHGMSTGEPYPLRNRQSNGSSSQATDFQRGDPIRSSFAGRHGMSTGEPYPLRNRQSNGSSSEATDFQRGDPNRASFARRRGMSAGQQYPQGNRSSDIQSTSVNNFQRGDPHRSSFAGHNGMTTGEPYPLRNRQSNGSSSQNTDFQRGDPNRASFARRRGMSAGQQYSQGNRTSDVPKEPSVRADHSFGSGWRAAAQSTQAKNEAEDLIAPLSNVSFKKPMEHVRGQFNKSDNHGRNTRNSQQRMYDTETDRSFHGSSSSNASFHNGTMIGIESHHKEQKQKSSIFSVFGRIGSKNAQQHGPPSGDSKDRGHGHASSGKENACGNIQSTSSQDSERGPETSSQFGETSFNKRVLPSNFNESFSSGVDKHNTSVCLNASFVNTDSKPVSENSRLASDKDAGTGRSGMLQKLGGRVAACLSKAFYRPDETLPGIPKVNKKKSGQRSKRRSSSGAKSADGSSGDKTPKTVRRESKRSSRSRASSRGDDSSEAEGMPQETSFNGEDSVFDEKAEELFHVPASTLKRSASSVSSRFSRKQSEDVLPSEKTRTRSSVRMESNGGERLNQTLDAYPTTGDVSFSESQMNQSFAGETGRKNARFVRNKSRASLRLDTSLGWSEFSMMEAPSTPSAGWRYVAFIKNLVVVENGPLEAKVGIYYTHDGFVANMPEILVQNGVCYFFRENSDEPVQMPPHFEFNLFPDVPCSPGKIIAGKYESLKDTDPRVEIFAKQMISGNKASLRDIYTQIVRPTPGSDSGNVFGTGTSTQLNNMGSHQAPEAVRTKTSVAPPVKRQLLLPKQVKAGRPENALPPTRFGELHTFSPPAQGQQLAEPSTPAQTSTSVTPLHASRSRWTVYKDEDEDHPSIKRRRNGDAPSTSIASHNLNANPETPRSRNTGELKRQFWRDCKRANPYAPQ